MLALTEVPIFVWSHLVLTVSYKMQPTVFQGGKLLSGLLTSCGSMFFSSPSCHGSFGKVGTWFSEEWYLHLSLETAQLFMTLGHQMAEGFWHGKLGILQFCCEGVTAFEPRVSKPRLVLESSQAFVEHPAVVTSKAPHWALLHLISLRYSGMNRSCNSNVTFPNPRSFSLNYPGVLLQ